MGRFLFRGFRRPRAAVETALGRLERGVLERLWSFGREATVRELLQGFEGEPAYTALYELESPEVLVTPAWAAAVEKGRWPAQVRPHTRNRRHFMWERI